MSTSSTTGCSSSTKKFRVEFNEELGRHLVASEDILPGETIIKENPLVRGPCIDLEQLNEINYENALKSQEDFNNLVCVQCFRSYRSQNGCKCKDCSLNLFCSTACSADIGHIYECEFFQKFKSHVVLLLPLKQFYSLISVLRCLSLRREDPKKWELIAQLQSKVTSLLEVGALKWLDQIFALECPSQRNYDDKIGENNLEATDAARHSFGVMRMNAFSDLNQSMGYEGLYFLSSLMAHSCVMNTDRHFTPSGEMVVKAAVLIHKGENITTTYLPLLSNTEQRHEEMKKSWFFQCNCPRCQDPEELGTHLSTVLPEGIQEIGQEIVKLIKSSSPKSQDVTEIETWLEKFDCNRWLHPNHSLFLQLKRYLCLSYGRQEGGIAGLSDETLKRKYQLCKQLREVYDIIYPGIFQCKGELLFEMWATLQEMKIRNSQVDQDWDEHSLIETAYQILKHASPSTPYKKMCDILEDEIPGLQQLNT